MRANFADRSSASGLFRRYARGRMRDFAIRQTMTLVGASALGLFGAPWIGALAAALVLSGEAIDCGTLWLILRHPEADGHMRRAAVFSAAIQGVTIAASILLCWFLIPIIEARMFAAAFLMGAAINAGVVYYHFPEGTRLRLSVYFATGLIMLSGSLPALGHARPEGWFFVLTMVVLGYTAILFVRTVEKGYRERFRFEGALLNEQIALEQSRAALAEEARRAERLALVARRANDSVVFTSPSGRIEWVNDAFTRITGYSAEEAIGRRPGDVLNSATTSPTALAELAAAQREGRPCIIEIENRTKDGRNLWMEVSMAPITNADGSPDVFIAIERDITQTKAHEAELSAAREAAEAAARVKAVFLATMSHEIRTPLNGVIGMAELLEETRLDPQQRQYLTTIIESGRALLTIINDVLDLSKLQSGKSELRAEPFSVAACVQGAAELLQPTARKKGIALKVENLPDLPLHLGDGGRLRQILLNLIGNAVKFTAEGQVALTMGAQPGEAADTLRIAVADTGIGIAPDRLGHVFDSFTQADASIGRQFGGTGLGLTISRLLAQQMGGDIEVSSVQGQGSVFTLTVRLPRAPAVPVVAAPADPLIPRTSLRVLVAEDNRTNMLIARKLLERAVASLEEASDGRIAVEKYRAAPPDLVLMDVSMPEMDGLAATRAIRAHEAEAGLPRCPVYALTAYAAPDEAAECLAAGLDGVLTKPLVRAELYGLLVSVAGESGGA
jgi:PAS domain S-box-containing protein